MEGLVRGYLADQDLVGGQSVCATEARRAGAIVPLAGSTLRKVAVLSQSCWSSWPFMRRNA